MEDLVSKHPKIGHHIFKKLSNQEVVRCRKVSKSMKSYVDQNKIVSRRKIKKYCHEIYEEQWEKVIQQFDAKTVTILADDLVSYYR